MIHFNNDILTSQLDFNSNQQIVYVNGGAECF